MDMAGKTRWCAAFGLAALAGVALHGLYGVLPNQLTAFLAPVNESVWEHLKLSFWPMLAVAAVLTRRERDRQAAWSGWLLGLLVTPAVEMAGYYVPRYGFAVSGLGVDIGLYVLSMALGFLVAARWRNGRWTGVLILFVAFYGMCLLLCTIEPPQLPVFQVG